VDDPRQIWITPRSETSVSPEEMYELIVNATRKGFAKNKSPLTHACPDTCLEVGSSLRLVTVGR
jgi:hypothetical protein